MIENSSNVTTATPSNAAVGMRERVSDRIDSATSKISDRIDSATTKLGEAVENQANALGDKSKELMSTIAHGGQYLRESQPKQLGSDFVALVKRHPVVSLAIGTGFGILIARALRR